MAIKFWTRLYVLSAFVFHKKIRITLVRMVDDEFSKQKPLAVGSVRSDNRVEGFTASVSCLAPFGETLLARRSPVTFGRLADERTSKEHATDEHVQWTSICNSLVFRIWNYFVLDENLMWQNFGDLIKLTVRVKAFWIDGSLQMDAVGRLWRFRMKKITRLVKNAGQRGRKKKEAKAENYSDFQRDCKKVKPYLCSLCP